MSTRCGPDDWKRLEELFNQAMELPPEARSSFVEESCGHDPTLRADLESLIRSSDESATLIEDALHSAAHDFVSANKNDGLAAGSTFANYEVITMLGAGGMGKVYLAEDARLRRHVALKTLTRDLIHGDSGLQRFKREARATSALNHPNILTIYEVGEYEGTHFIASEFVDGPTLREKLSQGRLKVEEVADIAVQIAAGLSAAHSVNISHRDIKPENIIIRKDGLLKIVDFGIAKLGEEQTGNNGPATLSGTFRTSTRVGMVLGTTKYMSPEQARGIAVDPRTDIFSLGAVIYEMLAGTPPFQGETDSDLIAEILKNDPAPLTEIVPGVAPELARIVEKAMAKDRTVRYETIGALAADLKAFKKDLEFQSRFRHARIAAEKAKPQAPPLALKTERKMWQVAVLVALLLAIGLIGSFLWKKPTRPSTQKPLHSLAILPFRNIRQDPATDFLGFSLADAVITKFGYISSVTVRPSSAIDRYRNRAIDPRRVAAELNVDTLLTGSFVKDGDNLRINTQMIDAKQNRILWRDSIDMKYENLLTVQDRVAQQIIRGLELNLTPLEAGNIKFDNPISRSAYEYYLRGVDLYAINDFSNAIKALEQSASMEPDYALTWAHLGRAYTANASLQFGGREQYRKAREAYQRALTLNPGLIEAQIYWANFLTDTGQAEDAVPVLRSVLKTNKNRAEAHWELGYAYRFAGILPESVTECERARELDPEVKLTTSAFNSYLYLGQYDKFLATLPSSNSVLILFYRGFGDFYKHNYLNAKTYFDHAFELDPNAFQAGLAGAFAAALRHRTAEGLSILHETENKIKQRGVTDPEGIYKISQAYTFLGDRHSGMRMLKLSVEGGFFCYPYFQTDPLINNLRGEPGFTVLMDEARTRHENFKARFMGGTP